VYISLNKPPKFMTSLFKESYLECFLDTDAKVLFHVWNSKPTSQQFRDGLTKVFNEYQKNKAKFSPTLHWLGDTRLMGVVTVDDQGWLSKVWNDMLFGKAGVKTHAVIIGDDVFAKYAMEKFKTAMRQQYADKNLHIETFPDKDSAYKWFKNIEPDL
jgi:hypothetical protein